MREGARICRSCGQLVGKGGASFSSAPERGPSAKRPTPKAAGSVSGESPGARRCEVCEKPPLMVKQIERSSPVLPGILAFVAFLMVVMALSWHSWVPKLLFLAVGVGVGYAGHRIFRMEHRYWLCPKCGDTTDIAE